MLMINLQVFETVLEEFEVNKFEVYYCKPSVKSQSGFR